LVIVLLWVYYSAQILFFGAQFTRVYTVKFRMETTLVSGAEIARDSKISIPRSLPT
jgi:membrane protein